MPLCPTCHSEIGTDSVTPSSRVRGAEGEDSNGNPIPFWTGDPTVTARGLNGEIYKGTQHMRIPLLQEIQEVRNEQEDEAGLPITEFSDLTNNTHTSVRLLTELRESTERLLDANGQTLEEYFKQDIEGNDQTQNPKIENLGGVNPQTEWVDVQRGLAYVDKDGNLVSDPNSPTIPPLTHLRAIHIEDLRHPIAVGIPTLMIRPRGSVDLFKAKLSGVNFKDTEAC